VLGSRLTDADSFIAHCIIIIIIIIIIINMFNMAYVMSVIARSTAYATKKKVNHAVEIKNYQIIWHAIHYLVRAESCWTVAIQSVIMFNSIRRHLTISVRTVAAWKR